MSLAKKSIANFIGGVVPAIASLLTVPIIVARLGDVQYGLFTLVTAIVGYFALIDINVTAGSVKYLSEHHARNEHEQVNKVVSFGGLIYFAIGLIGGLGIFFFADLLVTSFFKVPPNLHETARKTLQVAAVAFFFGQMQVYLLSVPQALQRYDLTGKVESFFGALTSISTVAVVLLGGGLVEIILVRLGLSVINCGLLLNIIRKILPFVKLVKPDRQTVNKLASFSAYSYLSRIAAISYANGDKLIIGALQNLNAVSQFAVPSLLVNRAVVPIYRLASVIFPVSSALAANNQHDELRKIYLVSTRYYVFLHACMCIFLSLFSREILHYWAGSVFGANAALVLVLVATATFMDALTNLPSLVNDGLGKPKNTGILAVMRAIFGLGLCYLFIRTYGYIGAAWAELIVSSFFSIVFLLYVHNRSIPVKLFDVFKSSYKVTILPLIIILSLSAVFSHRAVLSPLLFILALMISGIVLLAYAWFVVCLPQHHVVLKKSVTEHFIFNWFKKIKL
jgi:O-antigen/teichoic acid export membrane protein